MPEITTGSVLLDAVTSLCLLGGGVFAFGAALGVLRLQDVLLRIHAATKAGTLGVGLIVVGVALFHGETGLVTKALAIVAFLVLSAPVGAHMISRAAYRTAVPLVPHTEVDPRARRDDFHLEQEGSPPRHGPEQGA